MDETRLADIEMKLCYAEDMVDELNRLVFRQQQQIERLQEAVRQLNDQFQTLAPREFRSLRDEIPPHY